VRRGLNPWPAVSDLFSGLLVATFGGLMLFTGVGNKENQVAEEVQKVRDQVLNSLRSSLGGDPRIVGEDVFLDVALNFQVDQDTIQPNDIQKIARACSALKSLFSRDVVRKNEVDIWIEGHSDSSQPIQGSDRERYLYNWRLSGNRAASVLHEFHRWGVDSGPGGYRIFAIGFANTRPRPGLPALSEQHRRTTFRIRPDRCSIEARLTKEAKKCIPF